LSDAAAARRSTTRQTGFTLLEVLAAVMILGLWYTVIAGMAMDGLRAEGRSLRLLAAAQLADRTLAEVEATAMGDVVPAVDETILQDDDDFTVVLHIVDFGTSIDSQGDGSELTLEDAGEADPAGLSGLIAERLPDLPGLIRKVVVRVSWQEGQERREIRRTTHLFDTARAIELSQEAGLGTPSEMPEGAEPDAGIGGRVPQEP